MAIGSECDVEWPALDRPHGCQFTHHVDQAAAQQRLAAREPDFGDSEVDEDARHAQIIRYRHLRELRPVAARAAVDTLVVTAIGDGYPQIADAAAVLVE